MALVDFGVALTHLPIRGFERVRDLEYFEGPLLTEFRNESGERYVASWCDRDDRVHRWMVFRVSMHDLALYRRGQISLREFMYRSRDDFMYLLDVDGEGTHVKVSLVTLDELPESYEPETDSFFDPDLEPHHDSPNVDVLIDRKWELHELGSFSRTYDNLYTVLYVFGEGPGRPPERLCRDINQGRGFACQHLFRELDELIPPGQRPRLEAVHYASPGVISMRVDPSVARRVQESVLSAHQRQGEGQRLYSQVHRVRCGKEAMVKSAYRKAIFDLAEILRITEIDAAERATGNVDLLADLVCVHWRRANSIVKLMKSRKIVGF